MKEYCYKQEKAASRRLFLVLPKNDNTFFFSKINPFNPFFVRSQALVQLALVHDGDGTYICNG